MKTQVLVVLTLLMLAATAMMGPTNGTVLTETYVEPLSTFAVTDENGLELEPSRVVANSEARVSVQTWGVSFDVETHELTPGHVVTVWGVIFNEPSLCSGGVCNGDDVQNNTGANASMLTVGGKIVPASGNAMFFNSFDLADAENAFMGPGLVNAATAEIHVVLVDHGPVREGYLEAQLTTPDGGCDEAHPCTNVQFAVIEQLEVYEQPVFSFPVLNSAGEEVQPVSEVSGASSRLEIDQVGAFQEIFAEGLTPGDAVTSWWVIFNNPEACTDGVCDGDDVMPFPGNAAARVSVLLGDGKVVNSDGSAYFVDFLAEGNTTEAVFGPGLVNRRTAEIHYVLRSHGPAQQEILEEQLTDIMGGCAAEAPHAPCVDVQFSVFIQN